jgi:lipopolysaccharide transport system ATP-binding protein
MQPILEIKDISKRFRISHDKLPYLSLRDSFTSIFKPGSSTTEEFKALDNISFNIQAGESVGIIGRNGAGKSTLLKILSKITPPTSGTIISRGRIASLLEVGTGFHPELTGKENIFLNGSILGMKRKEIESKFEEIVDFSGVDKFLDTPLKHFSSGMQLRLAFSVAAFLDPEILIIDEVLAVGDTEFQKKCMRKMEQVGREGRTILFVSHNLGAVANLCKKGIVLDSGKLMYNGDADQAIHYYYSKLIDNQGVLKMLERKDRSGSGKFRFEAIRLLNKENSEVSVYKSGEEMRVELKLKATNINDSGKVYATLIIKDSVGERIMGLASAFYNKEILARDGTIITWKWRCQLAPGEYNCGLSMYEGIIGGIVVDSIPDAFRLNIEEGDYFGTGVIPPVRRDKIFSDFEVISST